MTALSERAEDDSRGLKLLLCENPLPPLDEAIEAAKRDCREAITTPRLTRPRCGGCSPRNWTSRSASFI